MIVLSLAIGIGANTAIFSVTSALLLKPLPYPHADRLALLWLRSPGIGIPQDWPSPGQYHDIRTQNHVFDDTAIVIGGNYTLTGQTKAMKVDIDRHKRGIARRFDCDARDGGFALQRECDGPVYIRWSRDPARAGGAGRLLHPGTPGDGRGSDGGVAL